VLLWEHYSIPQYHVKGFRLIHWDKFNKPKTAPSYDMGVSTWWTKPKNQQKTPPQTTRTEGE
jgi:microcin C transport system substrate-binding protein